MRIALIGSGYVGLVSAACFAELGHEVTSVDNDAAKIAALERGEVPIHEHFLPELLKRHHRKRLNFSTSIMESVRASEVVFITVGTPQSETGEADLSFVEAVANEIASAIDNSHQTRGKSLAVRGRRGHALGSLCESNTLMESDNSKGAKQPGLREQRYTIRYPFAADAEMLELQSGNRVSGVTSDLSAGGCFVCAGHPLEVGARVRGTLTHNGQKVAMLAVVRVVKARFGMGLEFLDLDANSHATLLAWIGALQKSRLIDGE